MNTHLFIDTEWADAEGRQLVSLALVSENGEYVFYGERDPLPENATQFVCEVVYPLLDRGRVAMDDRLFVNRLRKFLLQIEAPIVLYEEPNDLALLEQALSGFALTDSEVVACGPIPNVAAARIAESSRVRMMIEDWFDSHSDARAMRHHARVDAQALRMGWLAANGKIEPDWSATWREYRKLRSGNT